MSKAELHIAPCSSALAKEACERWHYTRSCMCVLYARFGVWENERFIGCVLYSNGGAGVCKHYGVSSQELAELHRVALARHETPVSRIVAVTLRLLRRQKPKLRLCVSYADPLQGHVGGIYQAGNWLYLGVTESDTQYWFRDRWCHHRTVFDHRHQVDRTALPRRQIPGKYRYVYYFDQSLTLPCSRQAYPKRCATSIDSDALARQAREGGARPTVALQSSGG